jgi:hypothetical protein
MPTKECSQDRCNTPQRLSNPVSGDSVQDDFEILAPRIVPSSSDPSAAASMVSNPRKPSRSAYSVNGLPTSPPGQHSYHRISYSRIWMVLRCRCSSLDHGYQVDGVKRVAPMRPSGKSGRYCKRNMGSIQTRPSLSSVQRRRILLIPHDSNITSHTSSSFDLQRTRPLPLAPRWYTL